MNDVVLLLRNTGRGAGRVQFFSRAPTIAPTASVCFARSFGPRRLPSWAITMPVRASTKAMAAAVDGLASSVRGAACIQPCSGLGDGIAISVSTQRSGWDGIRRFASRQEAGYKGHPADGAFLEQSAHHIQCPLDIGVSDGTSGSALDPETMVSECVGRVSGIVEIP